MLMESESLLIYLSFPMIVVIHEDIGDVSDFSCLRDCTDGIFQQRLSGHFVRSRICDMELVKLVRSGSSDALKNSVIFVNWTEYKCALEILVDLSRMEVGW